MAPKKSTKKDGSGATGTGGKQKKAKPESDGKKLKKASKGPSLKKAWRKGRGRSKGGDDDDAAADSRGAGRGVKPVRIKLDREGRDAILDILHRLHVAGTQDDDDGDDDEDEDEDDDEEKDDDEEEEGEDSEAVRGGGGLAGGQGHVDPELDGTFAKMANLVSDFALNEGDLPTEGVEPEEAGTSEKAEARASKAGKSIGEMTGGIPGKSGDDSHSNPPAAAGEQRYQKQVSGPPRGGSRAGNDVYDGSLKKAMRSSAAREKLLASMVKEDRRNSREENRASAVAAIAAVSTVGGGPADGAPRGYRRADPPAPGSGNEKVRLQVCGENKRTGVPDVNIKKVLVFDRKEPMQNFLDTCRGKLHIKKKAKGAALLEGEEVVDWLSDLSWVTNGAVVLISCAGTERKQGGATPRYSPPKAAFAEAVSSAPDVTGGEDPCPTPTAETEGRTDDQEGEEEMLALAALARIRESYRTRARMRQAEAERRGGGWERGPREELGKYLLEKKRQVEDTAPFRQMMAQRQKLPAFFQREDVVNTIRDNQVVVLSGETGCGKTTQVPQFVLDSLVDQGRGGECNIVCTQPRRISAVGVADRVAAERCERVGDTVGYQIRLESRVGPSTRLTFCTTGILLRRMTSDDTLAGVSHIMVDEVRARIAATLRVHERDLQTDFLLVILRDLLPKRPDLRVVLMSATLQADLFTKYFSGCPAITIPGRTFPVEITYMDGVNRLVRGSKTPALMPRVSAGGAAFAGRGGGVTRSDSYAAARGRGSHGQGAGGRGTATGRRGQPHDDEVDGEDVCSPYDPLTGEPLQDLEGGEEAEGHVPANIQAMVSPKCEEKVDYDIIVDLVDYILKTEAGPAGGSRGGVDRGGVGGGSRNQSRNRGGRPAPASGSGSEEPLGAILVFLPGFAEIDQLVKALERHPKIGKATRVFPLHSSLPSHQQRAIFQRMPPGVRKIVVSTNIAEASVTIDDCTHVIDAGRVRELRYDPVTRMSCLVEVWISKASGSQRAGRAGRVRPGKCWRLYPKAFHDNFMPPHTLAEMLRTPLEELVLQVLLLELGSPAEFLQRAVEPPPPKMLRAALRNLYDIQAIIIANNTPILTPLGYHLAHLPMDARVGKLLLIAAILQCLDPILTIAAALSDKAPFQRPFGDQAAADAARQRFAQHKSDHLAIVEAFGAWRNKRRTGSYDQVRKWCRDNFLSHPTLERLDGLREQFRQQLADVGFASSAVPSQRASGRDASARRGGGGFRAPDAAWEDGETPGAHDPDKNSGNIALVQSVLCAGLYPHVAAFMRPDPQREIKKGYFVTRDDPEPLFLHPSSINHRRFVGAAGSGRQVFLMYHSKMKTKQVYMYDSTYATPFSLLLWGARVRHERRRESTKKGSVEVVIDRWLRFRMTESTAVAFKAMRRELNNLLVGKIEAPLADTGPLSTMLVACLARLLDIEAAN